MCVSDSNLLVRRATDDDVDAIIELNRDGNGEDAAVEVRQGFDGAAFAPGDYAVVVDGTRVVSTLCLLRLHFALGDVVIPTGQPEFVVTHPNYRGRGLVRTLMDLVHGWSAERGDLLLVIAGIPYFYRQFGYDYGIPFPSERLVPPETKLDPCDEWETRPATVDDIDAVRALQDEVQSKADLRLPFEREVWRVLMKLPHVELAVAEDAGKQIGAVGRIRPIRSGHRARRLRQGAGDQR
jgi:predicted N-acetyltransferase YhbS